MKSQGFSLDKFQYLYWCEWSRWMCHSVKLKINPQHNGLIYYFGFLTLDYRDWRSLGLW